MIERERNEGERSLDSWELGMWALLMKSKIIFKNNILPEALGAIFSQQVHMYREFCQHSRLTLDLTMDNVHEVGPSM